MMEFCNFENCGLSFALFNKLVWALIMENGCRGGEREREGRREGDGEKESDLTAFGITFHFSNVFSLFFASGMFHIIMSVVQLEDRFWTVRTGGKNADKR